MDALSLIAVIAGAIFVPAIVLHVWYAIGLSRVFATHGGEPWRAWIPLVNEAELFRLGRLDPVRAVLLAVPGVNVYGLVLKATAAHRLGETAGRGAGTTALAVIFPPVWAGILSARPRTDAAPASAVTEDRPIVLSETASGPISTIPGASAAEVATAGRRRSSAVAVEPVAVPVLPGPVEIEDEAFEQTSIHPSRRRTAEAAAAAPEPTSVSNGAESSPTLAAVGSGAAQMPAATTTDAPQQVTRAPLSPIPSAAAALDPSPAASAGMSDRSPVGAAPVSPTPAPVGDAPASEQAAASVSGSASGSEPVADAGPASAANPTPAAAVPAAANPAAAAAVPAPAPAVADSPTSHDAAFDRVAETTDATAAPRADGEAPAAPLDELTQTARPRSRRRGEWTLALPDGSQVALTSRAVVLGRKPGHGDETVQHIAVADDTRTMSKQHARLEWSVTGWSITDLDSTNGITLVHDDGRAEKIAAGGTAVATGRFRLGDASVELRPATIA